MIQRITKLIEDLDTKRDEVMETYLKSLEDYDGHRAADNAGALHDLDRHVTNLHLELKRIQGMSKNNILSEVSRG